MFQANIAAGVSGFCALLWTVAVLVPYGWHVSDLFYTLRFDSGLYMVSVTTHTLGKLAVGLAKATTTIPDSFKPIMDVIEDKHSMGIMDMTQKICAIPNDYCDSWKRLQWGSYMALFGGIIILISHALAAMTIAYLVHSLPTEVGRQTSRICTMIPPVLGFTTLVLYFALTYSFGPSDHAVNCGWAFWMAFFAFILSLVPLLMFENFVNEKAKARIKERQHHKENFANYGAAELAQQQQPQGYGGYPAPQYGYGAGAPQSYPPQGYGYGGPPQGYNPYPPGPPGPPRY